MGADVAFQAVAISKGLVTVFVRTAVRPGPAMAVQMCHQVLLVKAPLATALMGADKRVAAGMAMDMPFEHIAISEPQAAVFVRTAVGSGSGVATQMDDQVCPGPELFGTAFHRAGKTTGAALAEAGLPRSQRQYAWPFTAVGAAAPERVSRAVPAIGCPVSRACAAGVRG